MDYINKAYWQQIIISPFLQKMTEERTTEGEQKAKFSLKEQNTKNTARDTLGVDEEGDRDGEK